MITISQVMPREIPEVRELLSFTWKDTYGKYFSKQSIEKITKKWHDPKLLTDQTRDPTVYFAVAKDQRGMIIGIITVRKVDPRTLFMGRIYVHPRYQGKGVGSELLSSALEHFSSAETLRVECEKQNNKACGFYLKQGFKIIGEKEDQIEGVQMETVVFEKKLK